jgi:hypothetical protein
MSEKAYGQFIVDIMRTLEKNGYPEKKVALGLEKMYEVAHSKGINFNKVLTFLHDEKGVAHQKTDEKIVFFPKEQEDSVASASGPFSGLGIDPEMFKGLSQSEIMAKAAEMVKNLTPEQISSIQEMMKNLSPAEREKLMQKAKEMGLI